MFANLSERLTKVLKKLSGTGRLTEENIKDTLRENLMGILLTKVSFFHFQNIFFFN